MLLKLWITTSVLRIPPAWHEGTVGEVAGIKGKTSTSLSAVVEDVHVKICTERDFCQDSSIRRCLRIEEVTVLLGGMFHSPDHHGCSTW
jgi:hypothetical protein